MTKPHVRQALAVLLAGLFLAISSPTQAQMMGIPTSSGETSEEVALPDPLTPEAIRALVSRLSDAEVRELLLRQLDVVAERQAAEAAAESNTVAGVLGNALVGVWNAAAGSVREFPTLLGDLRHGFETFIGRAGWGGLGVLLLTLAGLIPVGLAAERLVNRQTAAWQRRMTEQSEPATLRATLSFLGRRLFADVIGLLTFLVVTRVLAPLVVSADAIPLAHSIMVSFVVLPRLVAALSRFLLAPKRADLRLLSVDDWTASYLHRSQIGLAVLVGASGFLVSFMNANDAAGAATQLGFWLTVAVFGWLLVITIRARAGLASMARGWDPDVTRLEARLAAAYPYVAMVLIVIGWLGMEIIFTQGRTDLLAGGKPYLTLGLILMAPAMDTAIRGLVRHLVPPMQGEGAVAEKAWQSTRRSYVRIGRVIVFGIVVMTIARMWSIDFTNLASAGVGIRFAARLITVAMIVAAGYLVWEVLTLLVNRKLANEMSASGVDPNAEELGGEGGGAGGSRLSTILPLARLALQTLVIVLTVLIALGNLGIDVTPLLAGAGIVGLAIGFGAQTLVRDIVSGLFFLIDDAFRIGEYLVIDNIVGTVEKISIRSLQLRHHEGAVHTIPYGEIPRVTNNSRDWVIVKMRFTVPFETDVNKIKKIFKQIGKDIMEQPYAGDLIQTFKSQGVNSVDDVGIVVRGKFMSKPGKQWVIRKDIYARVQKAFSENGIEFARREVRVSIPELGNGAPLDEDQKRAVAQQAASAAAESTREQPVSEPGR
ncbi:mechanosensitive ion channel family protein [Nitratireductor mangrovi]|uniref:Mechanosensitive ion channel family protein n=1 Tax=Nitratireductor mangrovi TaxID=2599600 RepID=A0A5B8KWM3_9HYPH|nr:mechanosensitive ion channel family protein [Nitratireductor mangrovi]QDZ00074.1 mechanosensitive ion channel family protein [Nitratireductor mangrovi]